VTGPVRPGAGGFLYFVRARFVRAHNVSYYGV
jgi:hypothetical protein